VFDGAVVGGVVTTYKHADFLIDLGDIAKKLGPGGKHGFAKMIKAVSNAGDGKFGFRYEIQAAAWLAKQPTVMSLDALSKFVNKLTDASGSWLGKTDIDVIADGVYYQVKRSKAAFRNPKGAVQAVRDWVAKAEAAGAAKIKYIVPNAADVPGAVKTYLDEFGIEIILVPFNPSLP
jgi:hypothetical protein